MDLSQSGVFHRVPVDCSFGFLRLGVVRTRRKNNLLQPEYRSTKTTFEDRLKTARGSNTKYLDVVAILHFHFATIRYMIHVTSHF